MTKSNSSFTPWDFFQLAKDLAEHEVEMRIRLANAGLAERHENRGKSDPA
jgi:hypothetical protein